MNIVDWEIFTDKNNEDYPGGGGVPSGTVKIFFSESKDILKI